MSSPASIIALIPPHGGTDTYKKAQYAPGESRPIKMLTPKVSSLDLPYASNIVFLPYLLSFSELPSQLMFKDHRSRYSIEVRALVFS